MKRIFLFIFAIFLVFLSESLAVESFLNSPAKILGDIYNDLHFYKIDEGIEKAEKALKEVDKLYGKNPEAEINDPSLNWKKAYQVKSVLHTLLGMLYFRKSIDVAAKAKQKEFQYLKKVLKEKKKLSDEDIEYLAKLAEEQNRFIEVEAKKYATLSLKHFKEAIRVYPDNPYPHFQLAKYYLSAGELKLAEKELLKTARIYAKWKDFKALKALLQFVKEQGTLSGLAEKLEREIKKHESTEG